MPLWILNIAGFIWSHKRQALIALAIFIVLIFVLVKFKSCGKKEPAIDLTTVNKINNANETERRTVLTKTITDNADAVKTVDGRTTIAEATADQQAEEIRKKVAEADKKIVEARVSGHDTTQAELVCLLQPDANGCVK